MKYGKRPRLSARDIQLLLLIGLITLVVLATLIGADVQLSRSVSGGGEFFAPWYAARGFLLHHADPYGAAVATQAQQQAYGRLAQVGENPLRLDLPFFLLPAYFPLALIPDPLIARGLWLFLSEAALVAMALLTLRMIEWQPARPFQIALALAFMFSFYTVTSLLAGSPAILLGLVYVAVLAAYSIGEDEVAGALLVFALFAWELGLFFVLMILWKSAYDRRWRVWAGLGMLLLVLLIVSLLLYQGWIFPSLITALAMWRGAFGTNMSAILERLSPVYGERLAQAATVLLIILLLYEWSATRHADSRRFIWAGCLTLAVTPLVGLRIESGNLVVMLPGLALIFAGIANRWKSGYWLASLLLLILFLLPWAWFVRSLVLHDRAADDYILLFLPLFTAGGLYWTRWWFVRPPRTWLEHARATVSATQPVSRTRRTPSRPD